MSPFSIATKPTVIRRLQRFCENCFWAHCQQLCWPSSRDPRARCRCEVRHRLWFPRAPHVVGLPSPGGVCGCEQSAGACRLLHYMLPLFRQLGSPAAEFGRGGDERQHLLEHFRPKPLGNQGTRISIEDAGCTDFTTAR